MAKVFPTTSPLELESASTCTSLEGSTFTIWMKSLVLQGNGCTVYDSKGEVVYRVDNYDSRCSKEVYLMGRRGDLVCTIQRKRNMGMSKHWDGYRLSNTKKPWFQVRKESGDLTCAMTLGCYKYKIVSLTEKSTLRILDKNGDVVAEMKPKQNCSGMVLGNDVLSLEVKPNVDLSLVMALITLNGLINKKLQQNH